jgi:hypothetical protein
MSGTNTRGLLQREIDYTPTVICLAKVFEKEINLSLVHWVRNRLGIKLPPFFNRYEPGKEALFTPQFTNSRPIDFNQQRDGDWQPPALGESELVCRSFGRVKRLQDWNLRQWNRLLGGWHVIRVTRNRAAHTEFVFGDVAIQLGKTLDKFAAQGIFQQMFRLKAKYRGEMN